MITKLKAAKIANDAGIDMIIMNGDEPAMIYDVLNGNKIGTIFYA